MDNNLSNVLLSNNVASYSKQWMLPKWTIIWLIISLVIISWDVMFVLLRPASFAHGSLGYLWIPYIKYVQIDTSYADLNNPFVTAQALMSLMENAIGIMGLYYYFFKKIKTACLLIFSSQLLTCTKTILIFLLEIVSGFHNTGHNSLFDFTFYYFLPNFIWVVMPAIVVFTLGRLMISK